MTHRAGIRIPRAAIYQREALAQAVIAAGRRRGYRGGPAIRRRRLVVGWPDGRTQVTEIHLADVGAGAAQALPA